MAFSVQCLVGMVMSRVCMFTVFTVFTLCFVASGWLGVLLEYSGCTAMDCNAFTDSEDTGWVCFRVRVIV